MLDAVAAGDEIHITRHGRTVARLVPARGPSALKGSLPSIATSAEDDDLCSIAAGWKLG